MKPEPDPQPWYFQSPTTRKGKVWFHVRLWGTIALFLLGTVALVLIIWLGLLPRGGFSD